MNANHNWQWRLGALGMLLAIVSSGKGQSNKSATALVDAQMSAGQGVSEPAGASRCQFCHPSQVEGYARSAMAQSLRRAAQESVGTVNTPEEKITMYSSATGYWQRLESGGDVTNHRIDYVIGSGNHASGYLLDLAGHLFQSPVAYYTSRHTYDLAPGYEGIANPDFTRPVAEGCLFCHSGSALHVPGTSNQYRSPAFSAEGITCERCHGSAEKHLSDPRAGTIINPAKLEPAARDSICEQCHLLGVGRVLNPGKTFSDFRPGSVWRMFLPLTSITRRTVTPRSSRSSVMWSSLPEAPVPERVTVNCGAEPAMIRTINPWNRSRSSDQSAFPATRESFRLLIQIKRAIASAVICLDGTPKMEDTRHLPTIESSDVPRSSKLCPTVPTLLHGASQFQTCRSGIRVSLT